MIRLGKISCVVFLLVRCCFLTCQSDNNTEYYFPSQIARRTVPAQGRIEKGTSWKRAPSWKGTEKDMVKMTVHFKNFTLVTEKYSESLAITIRNKECGETVLCPQQ